MPGLLFLKLILHFYSFSFTVTTSPARWPGSEPRIHPPGRCTRSSQPSPRCRCGRPQRTSDWWRLCLRWHPPGPSSGKRLHAGPGPRSQTWETHVNTRHNGFTFLVLTPHRNFPSRQFKCTALKELWISIRMGISFRKYDRCFRLWARLSSLQWGK